MKWIPHIHPEMKSNQVIHWYCQQHFSYEISAISANICDSHSRVHAQYNSIKGHTLKSPSPYSDIMRGDLA